MITLRAILYFTVAVSQINDIWKRLSLQRSAAFRGPCFSRKNGYCITHLLKAVLTEIQSML